MFTGLEINESGPLEIAFRVKSKTDLHVYHTVRVHAYGRDFSCSCPTREGEMCAHVDASLVAGETFMVHPEDRVMARRGADLLQGRLALPETWKRAWQRQKDWRGPPTKRRAATRAPARVRDPHKPVVCFTGQGERSRNELIERAQQHGWEFIGQPSGMTSVLVVCGEGASARKIGVAVELDVPVVTMAEWEDVMLTGALPDREDKVVL